MSSFFLCHRQQQLSSIEAAKTGAEAKAAAALETVLAAVPRHRQDLVLIEALDKALDGAKKAATKKFVGSTDAGGTIATQIAALQQLLQPQVGMLSLAVPQQAVMSAPAVFVCWVVYIPRYPAWLYRADGVHSS